MEPSIRDFLLLNKAKKGNMDPEWGVRTAHSAPTSVGGMQKDEGERHISFRLEIIYLRVILERVLHRSLV